MFRGRAANELHFHADRSAGGPAHLNPGIFTVFLRPGRLQQEDQQQVAAPLCPDRPLPGRLLELLDRLLLGVFKGHGVLRIRDPAVVILPPHLCRLRRLADIPRFRVSSQKDLLFGVGSQVAIINGAKSARRACFRGPSHGSATTIEVQITVVAFIN